MHVVNTEVFNEGMKYTDAFYVATRFCMWQRDAKHSFIRISAEVRYVKSVNGIAKGKRQIFARYSSICSFDQHLLKRIVIRIWMMGLTIKVRILFEQNQSLECEFLRSATIGKTTDVIN